MKETIQVDLPVISVKGSYNPYKQHVITTNITLKEEGRSMENASLTVGLAALKSELEREKNGVGKVYVTLPDLDFLICAAENEGFIKEVNYPQAFHLSNSQHYINGVDMVYFLDKNRRASDEERKTIEDIIKKILTYQSQEGHSTVLRGKDYVVRRGVISDSQQIAEVLDACFLYNDDWPDGFKKEYVEETFSDENQIWVVCERSKRIVGIASAYLDDGSSSILGYKTRVCEINDCAVLPEERGKGIMKALVRMINEKIEEHNQIPSAYCTVQQEGIHRVMASLGFKITGTSEHTNHLIVREMPKQNLPNSIPYTNNLVFFLV